MGLKIVLKKLLLIRNILIVVLTPLLLLPIPILVGSKNTSMLFVGGLLVAISIETWNLHKRIALHTLLIFGTEPKRLLSGLMFITWFLSMWISNTATTSMMLPIADAILEQLKNADENLNNPNHEGEELDKLTILEKTEWSVGTDEKSSALMKDRNFTKDKSYTRLCKTVSLAIAYAANTGGTASITGTGPNLVLKGQSDMLYHAAGLPPVVTFATWMMFGLPLALVNLIVIWAWLIIFQLHRCDLKSCVRTKVSKNDTRVRNIIEQHLKALGPISFAEVLIGFCFVFLVLLWITRDLQQAGGWQMLFQPKYMTDATPAIFVAILLFILPSNISSFTKKGYTQDFGEWTPILNWRTAEKKLPWGIVLVLGGGFAIADVSRVSGLSAEISRQLSFLSTKKPWLMSLILSFLVSLLTEITSNVATASILMPIMMQMAISMGMHPLYLMFPAALACSFAFMLPVATAPNTIAYSTGHLKVVDMVSTGFLINVVCVLTLTLAVHSWGELIFHFSEIPTAFLKNANTTVNATVLNGGH
ncbi:Na(+)/citrate cotransporter isoform X2 [Octopus bimaculoides]|uniref:Na(+)/citrate cotransporter isoform X2 n=1 Tax=Octopus bimaculoides TaxID=37653 RepID=UPI00071C6E88|nr:Na(+)/citrate cotransporter isoform X2 [Octopus bimaculoides]|eukprot:XP_014790416.1 PREDICTED: solute carrier family 13 member 5-like isoform X2 [Octopus bimaculoides]